MKQVKVCDLKDGMVLAQDIYGKNGMLFIKKGVVVTNDLLETFARCGVSAIWIETPAEERELSGELVASIEKEVHSMLDDQFGAVLQNPLMQALKDVFKTYLIKKNMACVGKR